MDFDQTLVFELTVSFVAILVVLVYPWVHRARSVGLSACYVLNLAMIHWLGGLIHVLSVSWRSNPDTFTNLGFHQVFLGSVAFAIGSLAVAPLLMSAQLRDRGNEPIATPKAEQRRLPTTYLLIGLCSFGVLAPALRFIPSIGAISVCGIYLAVVGICLACWSSYIQGKLVTLIVWMGAVCIMPLVTIVTIGFVGFGAIAALMVFTFVATYYRPRWQAAVGMGVIIFLGLSLFVTYFRDRSMLRAKVWGGANYSDRVDTLVTTLSGFEFINLENPRHLGSIDARLNQNYLVGRVVRTLELGQEQFAYGGTIYEAMLALVPRIFWPDKPVGAGSGDTVSRYARMRFAEGTSVGIGHVMEFYINFGSIGVIVGFVIMGVLVRLADSIAAFNLHRGNWQGFMTWFVPAISLLNVGGSLVELFGTSAASLVLVLLVNRILTSWHVSVESRPPAQRHIAFRA